jgi:hypothetical protein
LSHVNLTPPILTGPLTITVCALPQIAQMPQL